ncbi:sugar transferase [Devosia submarina]|uniref:sugar transferase n=1 Tax=Devosia submarina TaxID=1173082 RepID=UPI001FECCF41|nr:sugar transferase [Devosia submarina]
MSSLGFQGETEINASALDFPLSIARQAANQNDPVDWLDPSAGKLVSSKATRILNPSPNLLGWQSDAKRLFDILVSGIAIIALMPLLILVALAIRLESKGPVLFVQQREGKAGMLFRALKFRSMRQDDCDLSGVQQTIVGDSRVTKVGSFIRRTSIDELPQLFNVLLGDMSLVGPRPHVRGMMAGGRDYRALVPYYDLRLAVTPGLTGWAQANGLRGPTTDATLARKRVDYDLDYIENFSLWLDLKIIWLTLKRELAGGSGH